MDIGTAWDIVRIYTDIEDLSEDECIIFEEALHYLYAMAVEDYDDGRWKTRKIEVSITAYNLAAHYEQIGKSELATKYYEISDQFNLDESSH